MVDNPRLVPSESDIDKLISMLEYAAQVIQLRSMRENAKKDPNSLTRIRNGILSKTTVAELSTEIERLEREAIGRFRALVAANDASYLMMKGHKT